MADQLWAKDLPLDTLIHRFTVGDDPTTDLQLLVHDCDGSAAHARMLAWVGLLDANDARALCLELAKLRDLARKGSLTIRPEQEDGHTMLEAELTARLGDPGKNIHLGRSRNDQVATAMRLWMRSATLEIGLAAAKLSAAFLNLGRTHSDLALPGYTHLRRAMPSTAAQWAASFAEGLAEEVEALGGLMRRLDRCPLGGAAGFGVPLPLDRAHTAALLGFTRVQVSPIDVQNSRGRHELAFANAMASIAGVIERFLWDAMLYSTEEFGFLRLPDAFTTGSSIMPQKRNPDVLELGRGRCAEIRGLAATLGHLSQGLPSSYHRDFQLFKAPTLSSFAKTAELLQVVAHLVPALEFNRERAASACTDELYAAQAAYERFQHDGTPFREAYVQVAGELQSGAFVRPEPASTGHLGSPEAPGLEAIAVELEVAASALRDEEARLDAAWQALWNLDTIRRKHE